MGPFQLLNRLGKLDDLIEQRNSRIYFLIATSQCGSETSERY